MATERQRSNDAAIDESAAPVGVSTCADAPVGPAADEGCTWAGAVVRAVEGWARQELRECAVALRRVAYSQPGGVGEGALLELSEQINAAADKDLNDVLTSHGIPVTLQRTAS